MLDKIKEISVEAKEKLDAVKDSSKIEELRVEFLGKKGKVIEILKNLKSVDESKRKEVALHVFPSAVLHVVKANKEVQHATIVEGEVPSVILVNLQK